ncbi:MAG: hypothetical protein AAGB93_22790, partial [Planctomycetota bacterium]
MRSLREVRAVEDRRVRRRRGAHDVGAPDRLGLKEILWHFLHFRLGVVTRRLENELRALEKRLHILTGFEMVFDALDE